MSNRKLPSLIFDSLDEIMGTGGYTFNSDVLSIDEWQIENVKQTPNSGGSEWEFDVRIVLKNGDNEILDDTDFFELIKNAFAINEINYNDIEKNRREIVFSLLQAI